MGSARKTPYKHGNHNRAHFRPFGDAEYRAKYKNQKAPETDNKKEEARDETILATNVSLNEPWGLKTDPWISPASQRTGALAITPVVGLQIDDALLSTHSQTITPVMTSANGALDVSHVQIITSLVSSGHDASNIAHAQTNTPVVSFANGPPEIAPRIAYGQGQDNAEHQQIGSDEDFEFWAEPLLPQPQSKPPPKTFPKLKRQRQSTRKIKMKCQRCANQKKLCDGEVNGFPCSYCQASNKECVLAETDTTE